MGNRNGNKKKKDKNNNNNNNDKAKDEEEKKKNDLKEEIKLLEEIIQKGYSQNESSTNTNKYDQKLSIKAHDLNIEGLEFEVKEYTYQIKNNKIKIGIIGRSKVGKTFILNQLINEQNHLNYINDLNTINAKYFNDIVFLEASSYDGLNNLYSNSELIKLIQEFVITISDILIVVIDNYKLEDLLILNIIKRICYVQKIIIIHNLYNLKSDKVIEKYIKEVLDHKDSGLEKNTYIKYTTSYNNNNENINYYLESFSRKIDNQEINIFHILYADNNIGNLKKKYNNTSLNYIKIVIENYIIQKKQFSLFDEFKNFIFDYFKNPDNNKLYEEVQNKDLLRGSLMLNEDEKIEDKLKIKKNKKNNERIVKPKYCIFKSDDKIKIYIEFYKKPLKTTFKSLIIDKNIVIILKGIKEAPNKNQNEDEEIIFNNFQNKDENYETEIKIPLDFAIIKTGKSKKIKYNEKEQILELVFDIYKYENEGVIDENNEEVDDIKSDKSGKKKGNEDIVKVEGDIKNDKSEDKVKVEGDIKNDKSKDKVKVEGDIKSDKSEDKVKVEGDIKSDKSKKKIKVEGDIK